jgi:hypothetical protein
MAHIRVIDKIIALLVKAALRQLFRFLLDTFDMLLSDDQAKVDQRRLCALGQNVL